MIDATRPLRALLGRSQPPVGAPRRVLISGAASGLGLALTEAWATRGWHVLMTDRETEALQREAARVEALPVRSGGGAGLPGPRIASLTLDVTDEDDWAAAREWVQEQWGGIDVVVNNAGVATGGRMEVAPMEDWRWIIDINLLGVVQGCRTFIPMMKEQGSGQLVNTASLAGLLAPPMMSSYNVVKAGVVALSETLHSELAPYGIDTTVVCPSFFRTNLKANTRATDASIERAMTKLVEQNKTGADVIAAQVVTAVDARRFLVLTDRDGRVAWFVKRFVPPLYRKKTLEAAERMRKGVERAATTGPQR